MLTGMTGVTGMLTLLLGNVAVWWFMRFSGPSPLPTRPTT